MVYLVLHDGADSFNMLVPYDCCGSTTRDAKYSAARSGQPAPGAHKQPPYRGTARIRAHATGFTQTHTDAGAAAQR